MFDIRQTHMGKMQFVEEQEVTGSAATTVTFDHVFDFSNVVGYKIFVSLQGVAGGNTVLEPQYEVSGAFDTTDTNYYRQYIDANGAVLSSNRVNDHNLISVLANEEGMFECTLMEDPSGYTRMFVFTSRGDPAAILQQNSAGVHNNTNTCTGVRFNDDSGAARIGVGSKFTLYKVVK